ncbi:MAG: hypothetical protein ACREE6_02925 [Limisphaerales bacterium]
MKTSAVYLLLLAALGAIVLGAAGCASPDNDSVRPWNSPEGYENNMPMEDQQHPN